MTTKAQDQVLARCDSFNNNTANLESNWWRFQGETSRNLSIHEEATPKSELGRKCWKISWIWEQNGISWLPISIPLTHCSKRTVRPRKKTLSVMKNDQVPCRQSRRVKYHNQELEPPAMPKSNETWATRHRIHQAMQRHDYGYAYYILNPSRTGERAWNMKR